MIFSIMTTVKINVNKVSLIVFFNTIAKMNDNMNEASFVNAITKLRLQIKAQAQAAVFYTPNQCSDTIVFEKGCPRMRDWPAVLLTRKTDLEDGLGRRTRKTGSAAVCSPRIKSMQRGFGSECLNP